MTNHPFHIVHQSPWPVASAMGALISTYGMVYMFHKSFPMMLFLGNMILIITMIQWWRDISREGTFQGHHTNLVVTGLRWGMVLFITSEVLFFVSFFWAFFHSSLSPTMEIGSTWPPTGVTPFNPFQTPLSNSFCCRPSLVNAIPSYLNFSTCLNEAPLTWSAHSAGCLEKSSTSVLATLIFIPASLTHDVASLATMAVVTGFFFLNLGQEFSNFKYCEFMWLCL